jgi:hypothetical protein
LRVVIVDTMKRPFGVQIMRNSLEG